MMPEHFGGETGVFGRPSSFLSHVFVQVVYEKLNASSRGTYSANQDGAYQVHTHAYPRNGSDRIMTAAAAVVLREGQQ